MTPNFQGLKVLVLESRRSKEMAALVTTYGGQPLTAPAMREVPLESNSDALQFADALMAGDVDIVLLLTGVGTRALLDVVETKHPREAFVAALARTKVVPRGPKPLAVLRELQIVPWAVVPEPNTWRELLEALDAQGAPMRGARVAVQEYGRENPELIDGLAARGAVVTRVRVYRYALPEDTRPLEAAADAVVRGDVDVVLFTTSAQVMHLEYVADSKGTLDQLKAGLRRTVVASIGPTTSEELRQEGLEVDLEASHPKMGFLVREAAEQAPDILRGKR